MYRCIDHCTLCASFFSLTHDAEEDTTDLDELEKANAHSRVHSVKCLLVLVYSHSCYLFTRDGMSWKMNDRHSHNTSHPSVYLLFSLPLVFSLSFSVLLLPPPPLDMERVHEIANHWKQYVKVYPKLNTQVNKNV